MKKIISFSALATCLFIFSCSKPNPNSGNSNNGGNNGGGNNGGGNNNGITISSISPVNPYPDDIITVIGTGFNADMKKDSIDMGTKGNGYGYRNWYDASYPDSPFLRLISASSTKIVFKAINPFLTDFDSFLQEGQPSAALLRVRTGGKTGFVPIPFKRLIILKWLKSFDSPENTGRPYDSVEIGSKGFSKNVKLTIDGINIPNLKIDSTANYASIYVRFPKTLFGSGNDETLIETKTIKVINPDGKYEELLWPFYLSPKMKIYEMHPEQNSFSLSSLVSKGGVVKIAVKGKCLKSDAIIRIVRYGGGFNSTSGLSVSGFQDNTTIEITPGGFVAGDFTVSILRGTVVYGACHFTFTP